MHCWPEELGICWVLADPLSHHRQHSVLFSTFSATSTRKYFLLVPECREVVKVFQALPFKCLCPVEESPNPNKLRRKQKLNPSAQALGSHWLRGRECGLKLSSYFRFQEIINILFFSHLSLLCVFFILARPVQVKGITPTQHPIVTYTYFPVTST